MCFCHLVIACSVDVLLDISVAWDHAELRTRRKVLDSFGIQFSSSLQTALLLIALEALLETETTSFEYLWLECIQRANSRWVIKNGVFILYRS